MRCMLTYHWSAFCSRAFIRSIARDPELPVPSPTFLLHNTYDEHEGKHMTPPMLFHLDGLHSLGLQHCPTSLPCSAWLNTTTLLQVHQCTTLTCIGSLGPAIWAA